MAQTLEQIISSLQSVYQPQLDSVAQQQQQAGTQAEAQKAGLQASQQSAFGDIVNGARQRGLGFSGIPLAEQARYTATNYLPAVANLDVATTQRQSSLVDAINSINQNKFSTATNLYQFGQQQELEQQKLAEQQREFDAQQRAAAAAAGGGGYSPTFGDYGASLGGGAPGAAGGAMPKYSNGKTAQDAYNAVKSLMESRNTPLIAQTYSAIALAAAKGSQYDQAKLQLLKQLYGNSLAKNNIGQPYVFDSKRTTAPAPAPALKTSSTPINILKLK